ncbi:ribosome rescue protein RqcH [Methanoregula sp.]|uniref:ribosome rescue protein RqcH n=1 Tax=Methanoregula sp. TaxID=2052170 RepID=UPI00356590C7
MATAQGMSGIDVRAVTHELCARLPLWIDKIYQFETRTIGIRLNGENHAKNQLLIEAGRRAHLVKNFPPPPKNPPQFAMLLRKYISGGKVLAIRQHGLERILVFDIGKGTLTYRLIIELFDEGNVILTDESYRIIKPLRHHRFKDRDIVPDAIYTLSSTDPTGSLENLTASLTGDDRDLVRALAVAGMLGGTYAEYVCRTAGIDKSTPASNADPKAVYAAVRALFDLVQHAEPVVSATSCEPVVLARGTDSIPGDKNQFAGFSEALEAFYPMTKAEKVRVASKPKFSQEERIHKYQETAIKKFDDKIKKTQEIVTAIYENYQFIAHVISSLDAASKRLSWQEIEHHLKDTSTADAKRIVAFYPDEAAVEIDMGKKVKIFVHDSVEQNAGRYYDIIKKFRKKKEGALVAMKTFKPKKKMIRHDIVPMKKLWYHRFRWFITSDGIVVLGGRDASQNEELVKKYMSGGDLFVHADVHGASVVIVKGKTEKMDEVAQFAASYSGAWRSGHFSADVFSAQPNQVSKTPESGEFVTRGSFIVRGERTYYRDVPVAVGIGLVLEPQAAVIGGPPAVIRSRTKTFAELKPGQYEPNDVAKKVLRLLRQSISPEEEKLLKGILNTEAVAAFVPPGGSDILGTQ